MQLRRALAGPAMLITIAVMFVAARWGLGLALGPALLLASALAPTDPVLSNELRVEQADDDDPLRFALSSEGGLNDGAASPLVYIALALSGIESLGSSNPWTFSLAVAWGPISAVAIGWALGTADQGILHGPAEFVAYIAMNDDALTDRQTVSRVIHDQIVVEWTKLLWTGHRLDGYRH